VAEIARIKVTIQGIRPPIWRRLEVPSTISLADLSEVILAAFGWSNTHLHEFLAAERRIGSPDPGDGQAATSPGLRDEARVTLGDLLATGLRRLSYTYDFGDEWKHSLLIEKLLAEDDTLTYPRCTAGRRAAPPEDCGGTFGYQDLLSALGDPDSPAHAELRDHYPFFDPEEFDLAAADRAVRNPASFWG
jgi:hypothetical protein